MKKKIRKNTQMNLLNPKGAGRPAINDPGIRHTSRPLIAKPSSLHLTVKIKAIKADIKNKTILNILKKAILNSRRQGLRVLHFSLEYDHIHLLIEADNNPTLAKGMKSFGVTLSKAINRFRRVSGGVYKHRYHFRQISSPRQLLNVMKYIFDNGVKHGTAKDNMNPFNSLRAEDKYWLFCKKVIEYDMDLIRILSKPSVFYRSLDYL